MPLINTKPLSFVPPPPLGALMKLLGTSTSETGYKIVTDDNNFYVVGSTDGNALLVKYNLAGDLQWQRSLGAGNTEVGKGVGVDSSGNVYMTGLTQSVGLGSDEIFIVKYNSSGTLQWQRMIGETTTDQGDNSVTDSSGNTYIMATVDVATLNGNHAFCLIKYNSSGVLQWQRVLGSTRHDNADGITLDNSGDIIVTGYTTNQNHPYSDFVLAKYNSSGTLQWQKYIGDLGAANDIGHGVTSDSSDNIYVTGRTVSQSQGNHDIVTMKLNSSGIIQWQKILGSGSADYGVDISVDSAGNVYTVGRGNNGVGLVGVVVKYNSSGTLQWKRNCGNPTSYLQGIDVHANGNMYITGVTSAAGEGSNEMIVFRLPTDGTGTGTFGYVASALVEGTPTMTTAVGTLTDQAGTLTDQAGTLTGATTTLTETTL